MQQTFNKTIEGHILEFNRLLYPVRYNILVQGFEATAIMIFVHKDEKGMWAIESLEKLPGWVREITSSIYDTIDKNESL